MTDASSPEARRVTCSRHGDRQATFVCGHIVDGLREKRRTGFFWAGEDAGNPYPDAWCADCEARVERTGGEWTGEAEAELNVRLICSECYDLAKRFHMGGAGWS